MEELAQKQASSSAAADKSGNLMNGAAGNLAGPQQSLSLHSAAAATATTAAEQLQLQHRTNLKHYINIQKCPISRLIVFQDQAEVRRRAEIHVSEPQTFEVIFQSISAALDKDSIRLEIVNGGGLANLLDVTFICRRNESGDAPATDADEEAATSNHPEREIKRLRHELDRLKSEGQLLASRKTRLERKQEVLDAFTERLLSFSAGGAEGAAGDAADPGNNAAQDITMNLGGGAAVTSDVEMRRARAVSSMEPIPERMPMSKFLEWQRTQQHQQQQQLLLKKLENAATQAQKAAAGGVGGRLAGFDPGHVEALDRFVQILDSRGDKLDEDLVQNLQQTEQNSQAVQRVSDELRRMEARHEADLEDSSSRELTVLIEATEPCQFFLEFSYIVTRCEWRPSYDIRVYNNETIDGPGGQGSMTIVYYGVVEQKSGEDWTTPESMFLSTSEPGVGGIPPDPQPQMVRYKTAASMAAAAASLASSTVTVSGTPTGAPGTAVVTSGAPLSPTASPQLNGGGPGSSTATNAANSVVAPNSPSSPRAMAFETINENAALSFRGGGAEYGTMTMSTRKRTGSMRRPKLQEAYSTEIYSAAANDLEAASLTGQFRDNLSLYATMRSRKGGASSGSQLHLMTSQQQIGGPGGAAAAGGAGAPVSWPQVASARFEVARPPTIISCDGEAVRVQLALIQLNPQIQHVCVPKRSPHAFLQASVQNNSRYALLAGPANIYIDWNFVGKTQLKAVAPSEWFNCKLGSDPAVRINYRPMYKVKESGGGSSGGGSSSSGGGGGSSGTRKCTHRQHIELLNTHRGQLKLTVLEPLPISMEDKIKVTLQEPTIKHLDRPEKNKGGVRLTRASNVQWDLDLEPNQPKELVLKYTIEHPAATEIEIF